MNLSILKTMDPFGIAIAVSALVHIVLIVALNFEPPDLKKMLDRMPPLDVVLVNAKTSTAPTKADALAQSNLDRGGNTDEKRQMKSALPAPKQKVTEVSVSPTESKQAAKTAQMQAEAERREQKVAELERQAQELMTQLKAAKKVESQPTQQAAAPQAEKGQQETSVKKSLNTADLLESSMEMARLEAQIAKQQDDYQKRPKRKFIGARTQEYRFATYVESWRQKVEKVGNLNYPEAAKDQKIYGALRMTVSIRADGSIENVEINQSSGFKVLDEAAKRIVELAAPYAAFPEDVRKDTDILSITRTWTFTKQDSLATE